MQVFPHILVMYGSTASGKSAFAMRVADAVESVIINADAMQCYQPLRIITARPSKEDEARHSHALYGVWSGDTYGDVARWLREVVPTIQAAWQENRLPILVGGTGMYLKALMEGLSPVPEIPAEVKDEITAMTHEARYAALKQEDSAMAQTLNAGDTQRVWRALEVIRATGKSLLQWQQTSTEPPLAQAQFHRYQLQVPREVLYKRINQRFDEMIQGGALEEVEAFLKTKPDLRLPICKAHGVPEIRRYLADEILLNEAIDKAKQHTRNYAKRQQTWARGQFNDAISIVPDKVDDCIVDMKKLLDHSSKN